MGDRIPFLVMESLPVYSAPTCYIEIESRKTCQNMGSTIPWALNLHSKTLSDSLGLCSSPKHLSSNAVYGQDRKYLSRGN